MNHRVSKLISPSKLAHTIMFRVGRGPTGAPIILTEIFHSFSRSLQAKDNILPESGPGSPSFHIVSKTLFCSMESFDAIYIQLLTASLNKLENKHFGFEAVTTMTAKISVFYDMTPCSPLKVIRSFKEIYRLHFQGRRISQARKQHGLLIPCLAYSSTQKMEEIYSSVTSVDFHWTTRFYIGEFEALNKI
jgi:hypothetical protein